jgi:hypothetical protein
VSIAAAWNDVNVICTGEMAQLWSARFESMLMQDFECRLGSSSVLVLGSFGLFTSGFVLWLNFARGVIRLTS